MARCRGTKGRVEGGQLLGCWPFPKPCGVLAPLGSVQVALRPSSPGRHVLRSLTVWLVGC